MVTVTVLSCLPVAVSNSRGEFLLNGEFVVSMFKREIKVGNAIIEYSGSDHVVERINCTDRIEEEIIVQVNDPYHGGSRCVAGHAKPGCSGAVAYLRTSDVLDTSFIFVLRHFSGENVMTFDDHLGCNTS